MLFRSTRFPATTALTAPRTARAIVMAALAMTALMVCRIARVIVMAALAMTALTARRIAPVTAMAVTGIIRMGARAAPTIGPLVGITTGITVPTAAAEGRAPQRAPAAQNQYETKNGRCLSGTARLVWQGGYCFQDSKPLLPEISPWVSVDPAAASRV